jgi:hypothetical protein
MATSSVFPRRIQFLGLLSAASGCSDAKNGGAAVKEDLRTAGGIKELLHSLYHLQLRFIFYSSSTAMRLSKSFVVFILTTLLSVSHAIPVCHLAPLFFP